MPKTSGYQIKENIKKIALRQGRTMKSIAQHVRMTETGFNGSLVNMKVKVKVILKIADLLNVGINTILFGSENASTILNEPNPEYKSKYYDLLEKENTRLEKENNELKEKIKKLGGS